MVEIGAISYYSLEDAIEREDKVLRIFRDRRKRVPFSFSEIGCLNTLIANEVSHFLETMSYVVKHLYCCYTPLFSNLGQFHEEAEFLITEHTFLESPDYFDKKKYSKKDHVGVYVSDAYNLVEGGFVMDGAHVRNGLKNRLLPWMVLIHEYGHAMHHILCLWGEVTKSVYDDYDIQMKEILAITAARTVYTRSYGEDPHKKALGLVKKLERSKQYKNMFFHQKWRMLLQFTNHKDLSREIPALKRSGFTFS